MIDWFDNDFMSQQLQKQRELIDKALHQSPVQRQIRTQRSRKGATIRDFIDMLADLTKKVLRKHEVTFDPDEGHTPNDVDKKLGHPYILYKVTSREPKLERKQRLLDTVEAEDGRHGEIWAQDFTCKIQFTIMAGNYTEADTIMDEFEDLLFKYTGYFKENGVQELLFEKQYTDQNYDSYRQSASVRSLVYRVDIQKFYTTFVNRLQDLSPVQKSEKPSP